MEKNKFFKMITINKEELKKQEEKNIIAHKLLNYEIFPNGLTEDITDEMIEWFTKDIQEKDKELEKIKNNIISIRKKLESLNKKS